MPGVPAATIYLGVLEPPSGSVTRLREAVPVRRPTTKQSQRERHLAQHRIALADDPGTEEMFAAPHDVSYRDSLRYVLISPVRGAIAS